MGLAYLRMADKLSAGIRKGTDMSGWHGIDLDGTLAHYDGWKGPDHVGEPVAPMLARVKRMLAEGKDVRILTARVANLDLDVRDPSDHDRVADAEASLAAIQAWCLKHLGRELPVTCRKDFGMIEAWDDRAKQVMPNVGIPIYDAAVGFLVRFAEFSQDPTEEGAKALELAEKVLAKALGLERQPAGPAPSPIIQPTRAKLILPT